MSSCCSCCSCCMRSYATSVCAVAASYLKGPLPVGHEVHVEALAKEYVARGQLMQLVAPSALLNLPAAHIWQLPAANPSITEVAAEPGRQISRHSLGEVRLPEAAIVLPGGHAMHDAATRAGEKVPRSHSVQRVAPVLE